MPESRETPGESTEPTRYLRVLGRLYPDNRLVLRPTYLLDRGWPHEKGEDSPLQAELYDSDQRLLLRQGLRLQRYVTDSDGAEGPRHLANLSVRGRVPFHPDTRTVRFAHRGILVHEFEVCSGEPQVEILWKPGRTAVHAKLRIRWSASHTSGRALHFRLLYTWNHGRNWQRVGVPTKGSSQVIDFSKLPGGASCRLRIFASDGVHTEMSTSPEFAVPVKACRPTILRPEEGQTLPAGKGTLFEGQGFYLEERKAENDVLEWRSSKDGKLGAGRLVQVRLSEGKHTITLRAGKGWRAGKASVRIHAV